MPFLPPNQKRQSTEGSSIHAYIHTNLYSTKNRENESEVLRQCHLPPGSGDIPAFTPAEAGTQFSDPGGMEG